MAAGLTISQAAAFAGVTVKTVRHYHRLGLVDEPPRDPSGYRRYGSVELLQLVRACTLARAGVPLADIPVLLDGDPTRFAATIAQIDRRLTEHIAELAARREALHRLHSGDRALLPDRACTLLTRLGRLGFDDASVNAYRESLILAKALFPDGFDDYLNQFEAALSDPHYAELIRQSWDAGGWEPDDPRIDRLAAAIADHLRTRPDLTTLPADARSDTGAIRYGMINHHRHDQSPAWERLTSLIERNLRSAGVDVPRQ